MKKSQVEVSQEAWSSQIMVVNDEFDGMLIKLRVNQEYRTTL